VPADTNSLTEQQQADPPIGEVSNANAKGHLKAARRAYAGQNKKPPDEQQIAEYLPLVHKIVQRAATYLRPPLTYDDLVSAGTVGLVKAARDYDPSFNAEFKTYAYIRIRGAVLDELRGWAFIPPNVNKQIRQTMDLSVEITKQTGTAPSESELAEKLGMTLDEVYQTFDNARAQQFLSIDGSGSGDTPALANILAEPDAQTPDRQFEQAELLEHLAKAIQELDERQRQIILLYYQQHLTMKQIAEVFKITEPRVSQLHSAALFTLSAKLRYLSDAGE